ncbi:CHC2 zinc finger domain-containing protein [Clostridium scatologenes]|uniref:Reverse transcriptase domain-containing protein n=1 Tax=Clostridium scatologenes TaxID=1548 RepID=A0A0E3JNJ1_CLOSL|nr:CHC2 zinc finger domain-containing protein [Clostridium scatologenes]AKA69329.1 hypothetical protein CSCA_2204 [Clostridium scatologenes]
MNSYNEYFESIIQEVDIVEACEKLGMSISKKGNQYVCLCPFHPDHHPSLNIYKKSNQYHCFSCGAHGNIFSLVKEIKHCEFYEAVNWIEGEFPEVLKNKPKLIKVGDEKSIIITNPYDLAYKCYLDMNEKEQLGLNSFSEERKYDVNFLKNSEVFWSEKNKLKNKFSKNNIEALDKLEKVELITRVAIFSEELRDEYRDHFFQDRVIVTLRDYHNKIVGFAGRAVLEKDEPKYLFSKYLRKGSLLYRLNKVKNNILKSDNKEGYIDLYLVEGIFDALRLESLEKNAVAVLGSHMTIEQTHVLEEFINDVNKNNDANKVYIHIFMDSDDAGVKGALMTIKNILNGSLAYKCICNVIVINRNKYKEKDADDFLKDNQLDKIRENSIDVFDFLFKYFAPDNDVTEYINSEKIYDEIKSDEKRIVFLNSISSILSKNRWSTILSHYYSILDKNDENYAFNIIRGYLAEDQDSIEYEYKLKINDKSTTSSMQNAVEVSKNSYKKEILPLDEYTWDRISMGADAFYEYFIYCLQENIHLKVPLLTMYYPKNKENNRKKSIYIHEQLIMQQYILNELLGRDSNIKYECFIPAVRFNPDEPEKMYTTGMNYYNFYKNSYDKVVSFAYQISMKDVNGDGNSKNGMFRPFYECWKSYISFIQDGVKKLNSNIIYRVKLDIKGFYDNISDRVIRDALIDPINEAVSCADIRFKKDINWKNDKANRIVEWIIDELFDYKYYDPQEGKITARDNILIGIPQGPNLSAYVANIILFKLDKLIMEYVNSANDEFKKKSNEELKNNIVVRFGRYVDDMIIVSSKPEYIVHIKKIITSELYRLGLSLSEKTDEADEISKDEAIEWTVSEKGGLGASSVFDFIDDDDIDTIVDDNYMWDRIDRRSALKILSNMTSNIELSSIDNFEDISETFFKTEEIRFNDIVRFSKLMIRYIFESEEIKESIFKVYNNKWKELIKVSTENSLFKRERIHILAFIEASIQLLNTKTPFNKSMLEENNLEKVKKQLSKNIVKFYIIKEINELIEKEPKDNILFINKDFLKIKLLSLRCLVYEFEKSESLDYEEDFEVYKKNEYYIRWKYYYVKSNGKYKTIRDYKPNLYKTDEKQMLNYFHYVITNMKMMATIYEYDDIKSNVNAVAKEFIKNSKYRENILSNCLAIWFIDQNFTDQTNDKSAVKIALKVILNFVSGELLTEVVGNNKILKDYIFKEKCNYLPVIPGVAYPGIFGVKIKKSKLVVKRIEFKDKDNEKNGHLFIQPEAGWEKYIKMNEDLPEINMFQYRNNVNAKSLSDFIQEKKKDSYDKCIKTIAEIYIILCEEINKIQTKSGNICILSKENIYVEEKNNEIHIILFCYCISKDICNYSVAIQVQSDEGSYIVKQISESGNYFWQAGFILKDAFKLEDEKIIALGNKDMKKDEALSLLDYSFRRLTGETININYKKRSIKSYRSSIDRTINTMKSFVKYKDNRYVYILNCIMLDSFISFRMNQDNYNYEFGNIEYYVCLWINKCMNFIYLDEILKRSKCQINSEDFRKASTMRRVVATNFLLSIHINNLIIIKENEKFEGLELLSKGLICSAILLNLKMQTLEQIAFLSEAERKAFMQRKLPYQLFGFDERIILIIGENSIERLQHIVNNILNNKYDREINNITPLGWILILAYILEIDELPSYIRGENKRRQELKESLINIKNRLLYPLEKKDLQDNNKKNGEFPFEQMNYFNDKYTYNDFIEFYKVFQKIDDITGTEVKIEASKFFNVSSNKDIVSIKLEDETLIKPRYFVTHGSLINTNISVECDKENNKVFTKSVKDGMIIGISSVEEHLSKLVVNDNTIIQDQIEIENEYKDKIKTQSIDTSIVKDNKVAEETFLELKNDGVINIIKEDISKGNKDNNISYSEKESYENNNSEDDSSIKDNDCSNIDKGSIDEGKDNNKNEERHKIIFDELNKILKGELNQLKKLFNKCNNNWKVRSKEFLHNSDREVVSFTNVDRIALFQFNIGESSYDHPESEECPACKEKGYSEYSSVEFRRRKLLEPVLEACDKFGVEILVLPEYSLRPETVEWLYYKIKSKDYSFSVWAGTFKVTPGYTFSNLNSNSIKIIGEVKNFRGNNYADSAILPIILNKVDSKKSYGEVSDFHDVQIIMERFKKYPSITLGEVINTTPAMDKMFIPVMKRESFRNVLFGDARDDVTELICAELFVMASPSNFMSFGKKSFDMYCKFNKGTHDFNLYKKSVIKDFETFGEYISFYQTQKKYNRTPIVLVPACTTRTADYYVNAQANYLASGITTVLCNSSGNAAKGGSCFIGQNSWDDYKLRNKYECKLEKDKYEMRNKDEYTPKNTVYHGLQPGIYQQSCCDENRGALGVKEQALLICDVNPDITFKGSPNPESIMDSLSIVAHIPVIEEDIFSDECKKCVKGCFNWKKENFLNNNFKNKLKMKNISPDIYKSCANKCFNISEEENECNVLSNRKSFKTLERLLDHIMKNEKFITTKEDSNPENIKNILIELSKVANSEWLKRRGEIYLEQHKNNPETWPAPVFLDWLYVVVNYCEFFYNVENVEIGSNDDWNKDYKIEIPSFSDGNVK